MGYKKQTIEVYDAQDRYVGHKALLESKSQSTLLEEQILAVALNKAQHAKKKTPNGEYIVSFSQGELKKLLKCTSNTIYERSKEAVESIRTRAIFWEEPKSKQYAFINLISRGSYNDVDKKLEIYFNAALESVVNPLKDCWTPLYLSTMLSWKKQGSFRLYEICRSHCYVPKNENKETNTFLWRVNVNELRYLLGFVDIEEPKVARYLKSVNVPDYDKAFELQTKKKYSTWSSFKRVIDSSIKEINASALSEITVDYKDPDGTRGVGGKILVIDFIISRRNYVVNDVLDEPSSLTEAEIDDFIDTLFDELSSVVSFRLKLKDLKLIAEKANYDMPKIIKACKVAENYENLSNAVGFIIKAMEEDWDVQPVEKIKKKKVQNSFNAFEQRDYDFEEIEKVLRAN